MKSIRVKSYNKLIEDIKLDGDTSSWNGKLKKRIVDALRLAKECRAAAKIARENGDIENTEWLEKRADDYEQAAKNWNQDLLDDEQVEDSGSSDKEDGEGEGSKDQPEDEKDSDSNNPKDNTNSDEEKSDIEGKDSKDSKSKDEKSDSDLDVDSEDEDDKSGSGKSKSNTEKGSEGDSSGDSEKSEDPEESNEKDSNTDGSKDDTTDSSSKGEKDSEDKDSSSNGSSSDNKEDEDEDSDESESDDAPIKDPFADDEDIPNLPKPGQQGEEPRDPTVDEIIKQLKGLDGEAKRGAIDGLTDLLNKKTESLKEAFKKSIREFSDEEWADLAEETIDRIEKVKPIDTIDNIDGIKATFKSWSDNAVSRQELEDEENQNIQKDILSRRAREKEIDRYGNLETLKDFEIDFENCIRDQVDMVMQEYQSYDEINPEYEDEDIIMKADIQRMIPDEAIPTIAIFFDQSGSWYASDIQKGNQAIASVKKKYVDTGLCKLDLYYFGNTVYTQMRNNGNGSGGTHAWPYIIDTIKKGDYKNVVIMSDSDIGDQNNNGESWTVEGCVWWIWRHGSRADRCTKELKGMQHNFECEFN